MAKQVTINAPSTTGEPMQITGNVVHLYVGKYRHKFLIQETATSEKILTDYASGMRLASLTPVKLRNARSYARMTDRAAAIETIADLIAHHGVDKVRARLNNAPAIN